MRYHHALCLYPYVVDQRPGVGIFPPTGLEYIAASLQDLVDVHTSLQSMIAYVAEREASGALTDAHRTSLRASSQNLRQGAEAEAVVPSEMVEAIREFLAAYTECRDARLLVSY